MYTQCKMLLRWISCRCCHCTSLSWKVVYAWRKVARILLPLTSSRQVISTNSELLSSILTSVSSLHINANPPSIPIGSIISTFWDWSLLFTRSTFTTLFLASIRKTKLSFSWVTKTLNAWNGREVPSPDNSSTKASWMARWLIRASHQSPFVWSCQQK